MNYDEFVEKIKMDMTGHFPEGTVVRTEKVKKNNGVLRQSVSVCAKDAQVAPVIYLDMFYDAYQSGVSIEEIDAILFETFERSMSEIPFDPEWLSDRDYVKDRLICRLVNMEKNREALNDIPHVQFMNLSLIYYILMEDPRDGVGGVRVSNDFLETWNMDRNELHETAVRNTARLLPWEIHPLSFYGVDTEEEEPDVPVLYVLTNRQSTIGAYWITQPDVRKACANVLGSGYYILPSSIHECLLVADRYVQDPEELGEMVREINALTVREEERLADCAYHYDAKTGEVVLIA